MPVDRRDSTAALVFVPNRHPRAARWDDPSVTHDLGAITDVWARWDSVWFLRIAKHGYDAASGAASAFYPLYPGTVGLLGRVLFGHYVLAGILISLAAAFGSFLLLHRVAEERLGRRRSPARRPLPGASSPSRSSCRPSTASRSTSCSRSPPSCSPSAGVSRLRARSRDWRS